MIKATELRIGNWVLDNKIFRKVTGIKLDELGDCVRLDDNVTNRLAKNIEPIPLTPEILEKCGFKKKDSSNYLKGEIELWQVNNDIHYSVHDDYHIAVNSVHQLQNLYFWLSGGEELEINL